MCPDIGPALALPNIFSSYATAEVWRTQVEDGHKLRMATYIQQTPFEFILHMAITYNQLLHNSSQ